jgi:hypothetical protein
VPFENARSLFLPLHTSLRTQLMRLLPACSPGNGVARRLFRFDRAACDFFRIAGERLLVYQERTSEEYKKCLKRQRAAVAH